MKLLRQKKKSEDEAILFRVQWEPQQKRMYTFAQDECMVLHIAVVQIYYCPQIFHVDGCNV